MMKGLAKLGFSQTYTYFTWRNTKNELIEYIEQLQGSVEYYRPNFSVNTPDILHEYLQTGGRPAFKARLVLAASLSPAYGVYSGYERFENVPVAPGSEEYLGSEKWEVKPRSHDGPMLPNLQTLNEIRRADPALHRLENLRDWSTSHEQLIGYAKGREIAGGVNIDPLLGARGPRGRAVRLGLPEEFPDPRPARAPSATAGCIVRHYVRPRPGKSSLIRLGA